MSKHTEKREIRKIGIDLAKNSFQLYAEDAVGKKVMNRKMNKKQLKEFMIRQQPCLVGMEACGTAHYWARLFRSIGHEVKLIALFREELHGLYHELQHLEERVEHYDQKIESIAQSDEQVQRLMTIPGIGPMGATALLAAIGDINLFNSGREVAAWLGLVPRQHSTGGKPTLLGISKRGDVYLRKLLIHGARSVMKWVDGKLDPTSLWAKEVKERRNFNIASVAMANKMVRVAYALLSRGERYQQDFTSATVQAQV